MIQEVPNDFIASPDDDWSGDIADPKAISKEAISDNLGLSDVLPSDEDIVWGIENARSINRMGETGDRLAGMEFVSDGVFRRYQNQVGRPKVIEFDKPMFIDPARIISAQNFNSWQGRGVNGSGGKKDRTGDGRMQKSVDIISDYSTRDTQIPPLEFALDLVITDEGSLILTRNAHTVAAAKLRQEPVQFNAVDVYDARSV